MISASPKHRVFLAVEPIDFRRGIDGIVRLCSSQLRQDPMSGHYFVFHNKRKTDIKVLYYDSQGYCLFQKRLSCGKFTHWPKQNCPLITLTSAQLQVLIFNGNPALTDDGPVWQRIDD